jgi:hypothetical protein
MIYYSKQKVQAAQQGAYIKQRCSIEKRCSKKRKDYGGPMKKQPGNAF